MSARSLKAAASLRALAGAALLVAVLAPRDAKADESGVSFWLPGQYGSLIAAPQQPGWSLGSIYLHTSVDGGGDIAAARQIIAGGIPRDIEINLNAALEADVDLLFVSPAYTFSDPVLGGRLTVGVGVGFGYSQVSIAGDLTVRLEDGTIIERSGRAEDERGGVSDLYPSAQLRWNRGVHNYMVYAMGDVPTGTYDSDRLANVGIGHGAIDGGVGYTYFNPESGREFSAASGLTYNFENEDTDYQNGVDWHLDWAASQFLSPAVHVGVAGYFYQQLTEDEGAPEFLGDFESSAIGVGPQMGFLLPVGGAQGYLNFKGFYDLEAENRPDGWSVWLTFAVSPHAQHHQ